ncbi:MULTISPECIES: TonB-dependent receptor [Burkholderia]|uniref:TonB-dependent receptor n=1 Tax=Burkholderia TaxID=32008 RepID=UPI000F59BFA4|nr:MULTISPECIES: TonB-dependent receptor [Burkholderia]MBN3739766.1 TonB-dependent receptor [Burkholderia sp. Tr-20355]RQS85256.1 TonB-dependent receptor [Burkholderia seminalis]
MPAQFKTRPRALVSALTCSVFLTPLLASAATAPATAPAPAADRPAPAADAPATLPTIAVQSSALSDMQVKRSPSYKFTAPLLDTPRSVTVIPEQLIKEKNVTSFADALRSVPGITFLGGDAAANPSADRPVIRGFESRNSIFVDGMRDSGLQNRETFAVEQISVIKGPDSVYAGRGSVGGSVDIVTKTPKNDNFVNSSIGFGTDGYKRATVDANRKINDTTAVRLNVMGHDANQAGRNDVYNKRWGVAPSIVFGLNTPTTVTVSYYHMNAYDMPDFSVPFRASGGTPVPTDRGQFFGLNTRDYRYGQTDTGEVRVEHKLNDDWKLKNTTMFGRTTLDYVATNPQISTRYPDRLGMQAKSGKYATNGIANQTEITGRVNLFGMQHTMTAGVEFSQEQNRYEGYLVTDASGTNLRTGDICVTSPAFCAPISGGWNPNMPWTGNIVLNGDKGFPGATTNTRTTTASAYLFDTVKLTEQWLFNAGLRFDRYDLTAKQAGAADLSNTSNLFSYQFGLVYKPVRTVSLYASYGTSSNPPGSNGGLGGGTDQITANNQNLSPERTRNIEVGAKWDVIDQQLSLTSALFDTEKTNAQVSDGLGHTINAGKQRVRGAELGFAGNVTDKWHVFGGYTYLNAVTVDAGPGNPGGSGLPMVMVPKHSFTLWTSYDVMPKLTLGAGATVMSKTYASVSPTVKKWTPGYARFDAAATWRVNKTMDVQLNVQNLFDKKYYASAYPIYATWAPGRSAMVTLNFYQ